MDCDFFVQGETTVAFAHGLFDRFHVLPLAAVLLFLHHGDARAAVVLANVLNEIGSITNRLTFQGVNEGAGTFVEAVRATHLESQL